MAGHPEVTLAMGQQRFLCQSTLLYEGRLLVLLCHYGPYRTVTIPRQFVSSLKLNGGFSNKSRVSLPEATRVQST